MQIKDNKKYKTLFSIDDQNHIVIESDLPLQEIDCCYEVSIYLQLKDKRYILAHTALYYGMQRFRDCLDKALKKQLYLHESITKDLGYLFNEYSHNELLENNELFVLEKSTNKDSWVGYKYSLWTGHDNDIGTSTWIYNNHDGKIILEVSTLYIWQNPHNAISSLSYQEWIKNYQIYFLSILSQATARQWIQEVNYIIKQIDANIKK